MHATTTVAFVKVKKRVQGKEVRYPWPMPHLFPFLCLLTEPSPFIVICLSPSAIDFHISGRWHVRTHLRCAANPPGAQNNAVPIRIPRSLEEIDNGKILGFGADLAEDHPGYHDDAYKRRRVEISEIARHHVPGTPIPQIVYLPEEAEVWSRCVKDLKPLWQQHACREFLRAEKFFDFVPERVPQLEELNSILQSRTGWCLRPTAGLLHPRDFLAGLYFQCFHSTQYVRHHSNPSYTPEPDLVHEALGHLPMLADPAFCELAKEIGRASLGADEKTIWVRHDMECSFFFNLCLRDHHS